MISVKLNEKHKEDGYKEYSYQEKEDILKKSLREFNEAFSTIKFVESEWSPVKVPILYIDKVKVSDSYYKNIVQSMMIRIIKKRLNRDDIKVAVGTVVSHYDVSDVYDLYLLIHINEDNIVDRYDEIYNGLNEFEDTLIGIIDYIDYLNELPEEERMIDIVETFMKEILSPEEVRSLDLRKFLYDLITKGSDMDNLDPVDDSIIHEKDPRLEIIYVLKNRLYLESGNEERLRKYVYYIR